MKNIDNSLVEYLTKENLSSLIFKGDFGLEKENVRVDEKGRLALTLHPREFGDKLQNPYIKTDFSESQIEVVTPVCNSIEEVYNFLENLHDTVSLSLDGEYLWPQSNPPILPEDEAIPIAIYDSDGINERQYRERLAEKYGRKKQLLSGIHYNYSFDEEFLEVLYREIGGDKSYKDFKDNVYLKITRNFLKYGWLLIYLTGASPVFHNTFEESYIKLSEKLDNESHYFKEINSLRNSKCGYRNDEDLVVSYNSVEEYVRSIQSFIDDGKIQSASEFYNSIRLKGRQSKGSLEKLKNDGIKYVELRIFDLNPFSKTGIFLEDLYLTNLFMIYMFLRNEDPFDGRQRSIPEDPVVLKDEGLKIIDDLKEIIKVFDVKVDFLNSIIDDAREKILDPRNTYAYRIMEEIKHKSYIEFHMEKAKEYLKDSRTKINLIGYEDMELSTQILIRDAIRKGINFKILDRSENFIRLSRREKVEYVKQATKTSRDSYITMLIMENKVVTKEVLKEHHLRVPLSESFNKIEDATSLYNKFKDKKIVIKPKSTNYGLGISILKAGFTKEQFEKALEIAFRHDITVLVEEFVEGKEYRFLVIGNEVVGVLHRVPANVRGDGVKTIKELVDDKNRDPLRGTGHKTPLEKIVLGEIEEMFIKSQGRDFDYIPNPGEVVFLRENSNISTGGDSIDCTDYVHESYKKIALEAAKSVGAAITGVDMIIQDVKKKQDDANYAIIELNFNPAMYMHCYPFEGKNRRVGEKILDLLFNK